MDPSRKPWNRARRAPRSHMSHTLPVRLPKLKAQIAFPAREGGGGGALPEHRVGFEWGRWEPYKSWLSCLIVYIGVLWSSIRKAVSMAPSDSLLGSGDSGFFLEASNTAYDFEHSRGMWSPRQLSPPVLAGSPAVLGSQVAPPTSDGWSSVAIGAQSVGG